VPLTMEDVRRVLSPDEPNYAGARELGPDAIPFLRQLIVQSPSLAAKAVYLAGLIGTDSGAQTVAEGARSHDPAVRVAAATAARELESGQATPILELLLTDMDRGVRQRALRSAATRLTPTLRNRIEKMTGTDHDQLIRSEAAALLRRDR
jgi:HEAT repeat protein